MKPFLALYVLVLCGLTHAAEPGALACIPSFATLSPMARTAELANIARAESREMAQQYLGRGGFFKSKAYAWGVREVFYDNERMETEQNRRNINVGGSVTDHYVKLPWGKVGRNDMHRMYDDLIQQYPAESARGVLEKLLEKFDDSFLTIASTPEEGRAAVEKLAALMRETGLTQEEVMQAFQQMTLIRNSPELKARLLGLMAQSLPVQAPIILRDHHARDLARRIIAVPTGGSYQVATIITGVLGVAGSAVSYFGFGDPLSTAAEVLGAAIAAPIVTSAMAMGTRAVMAKFSSAVRKLRYGSAASGEKNGVKLEQLANVSVLPEPKTSLPLSISSPTFRFAPYETRTGAIASIDVSIPGGGFNPRVYGLTIQKELAAMATSILKFQKFASARDLWQEVDRQAERLQGSIQKKGAVNRGDAVSHLMEPLMRKLEDFETLFVETEKLRNDTQILKSVTTKAITAATLENEKWVDELKRLEENDPRMAPLERKILLLGDRVQMLKQTELKLGGLLHSLDVSEDALATEKNLVETMGHALLGPDGAITDVNQALDPAAIETLKSLRAAVVAKNGATKP